MAKHKHKYSFLYKYVALLACLCLAFGVTYTIARYSTTDKGNGDANIDPFLVDAKLYDDSGLEHEVTDLSTTTYKLEEYTATYYLVVYNYCDFNVFYEVSIEEPFIFSVDTITSGNVPYGDPGYAIIPLYISVDPDATLDDYKENNSIPINIGVDVIQGEIEEEVLDPHALTNRNITTCEWSLDYYYLVENITTSSGVTFASTQDNVDLYLNGYTLSSTSNDYIITISSGSLTLANGTTLTGYDGNDLTLSGSGFITNTSGGGINVMSGASLTMSNQSIVSCLTHGVNVNTGAAFTISGSPIIDNTNTVGVYLCSGVEIILGDYLVAGADIYIDLENAANYVRVTSIELDGTSYYYTAAQYFSTVDSDYQVTVAWDSYDNWATGAGGGCLQLIEYIPVNVTVAVQNTGNYLNMDFYTDAGNSYRGWDASPNGHKLVPNQNKDTTYAYDYYYYLGETNRNEDYGFVIGPKFDSATDGDTEEDKLYEWGIAKSNDLEMEYTHEFNFWGTQFDGAYWQELSEWGFAFASLSDEESLQIIHKDCQLTVVLMFDFNEVNTSGEWGAYNNIVTDYYFIVDEVKYGRHNQS